jgi:two-component system cell cycle sensor histidine kinase/response regulator CckA
VLVDYLQPLGYRVLTAVDGVDALELLVRTREQVRLVISDMNMPRMNGLELYRSSRELWPTLAFLFCTAGGPECEEIAAAEDELTEQVEKPCDMRLLGARVRELLARVSRDNAARAL